MEYKHRAGTWFRHYKGAYYATLEYDDVLHTETGEQLVLYRRMYPNPYSPNANTVFARPADHFYGILEDGTKRFTPVDELPDYISPLEEARQLQLREATEWEVAHKEASE